MNISLSNRNITLHLLFICQDICEGGETRPGEYVVVVMFGLYEEEEERGEII